MEPMFEYIGELIDPEQAPLTLAVYACERCGALVVSSTQSVHVRMCPGQEAD